MRKLLLVASCLCLLAPLAAGQSIPTLKAVKKIYVDELGTQTESLLIREKIRMRLAKSKRFSVVEQAKDADAILTGAAGLELTNAVLVGTWAGVSWGRPPYNPTYGPARRPDYGGRTTSVGVYGGTDRAPSATGVFRLVETQSQENIWRHEIQSSMSGSDDTGAIADKAVRQLIKDAKKADGK
jgi:hypothetical protein